MFFILIYSHVKEKPHLLRVCFPIIILRNIVPIFNFENRKSFEDLATVVQMNFIMDISVMACLITFCINERWFFHLPFSIVCQFSVCLAIVSTFYENQGEVENHFEFV